MKADNLRLLLKSTYVVLTMLLPTTASAQSERADDRTITVTGSPLTLEQVRREAKEYVRETGIAEGVKPAARWTTAICPAVIGVSEENGVIIRRKIEEVARTAKVKFAAQPCATNIVVAFAYDGRDLTRRLAKKPGQVGDGDLQTRKLLVESNAPVRWWYNTALTSRYGSGPSSGDMPGTGTGEDGASSTPGGDMIALYNSSIVSTQVKRVLTGATVIVDVNRAEGTKLDAIAALAALVVLAEIEPDARPAGSILSLFPAGSGIADLSDTDRQMLKTLYTLSLDRTARRHRGRLLQGIVQAKLPDPKR